MKAFKHFIATIFLIFVITVFWGCSHYTNPATDAASYPAILERAKKNKRYFIMQSGINLYTVNSIDLDQAKKQMTVTLDKADSLRLVYFRNPGIRQNQQQGLANEIHLYMKDSTSYTLDEPHTIPLERVAKVETLD
ncbi:MAG: hypothetical protein ACR2KZ_13730 [Segetibacter sp.]